MNEVAMTINELHKEILQNANDLLKKIIELGRLLTEIKEELGHGKFVKWIDKNALFSMRTAQRYMRIYKNKDLIQKIEIDRLTSAYKLLEQPPKSDTDVAFEENHENEVEQEYEEIETHIEKPKEKNQYEYWNYLSPLIEYMYKTYEVLATTRNHTTPEALGDMIGNIKDMAIRLETWNPKNLQICPKCSGEGQIKEGGKTVTCPYCINGLTGISKPTEW